MNPLLQDVRYALRQLRKNPGFAAVAVLTLALGIGANAGIFTLINAVLLKSLPVPNPEQLYLVRQRDRFAERTRLSFPLYKRMAEAMPASASLAAMTQSGGTLYFKGGDGQPEAARGQLVSGNYFQTFQTYPALGRLLTPADNQFVDGHPVAVISYEFWKSRLAADPNVIGRDILINGARFSVVGVTAEHFFGAEPGRAPDFWLPLMMQSSLHYTQNYSTKTGADEDKPWVLQEDISWLQLIVRAPEPGELAHISGVLNQFALQDEERNGGQDGSPQSEPERLEKQLVLEPGGQGVKRLQREFSKPLLVLAAMVGMVLLIACANLAGLLLARAAARTREMAVRLSIGATRQRLIGQLLTECLLLSTIGGLVGIGVAYACDAVLPRWASSGTVPIPLNLEPDARVLLFSIGIVAITGVLFGLAPALQAAAIEPVTALKASASRAIAGHGPGALLRQGLIVTQLVLALVLLVGAGLFLRTLRNFVRVDPGFDRYYSLVVSLETSERHYSHDQLVSFFHQALDRVQALPEVRSASLATCGLAAGCRSSSDIYLPGQPQSAAVPQANMVSVGYFENVGMPLVRGRDFAPSDDEKAPHVVIINQTLARKVFGTNDPIGQRFGYDNKSVNEFQVVGVVADAQVNGVLETAPPMMFFPLFQDVTNVESLDVRTASDPTALSAQVRQVLTSIDPDLPIAQISTMSEQVSRGLAQQRLIARLTAIFGGVALGLACLGLYGVMSYTVARRTGELGVRLALGASRESVLGLVMRQTIFLAGAGIVGGLLLSLLMAHFVGSLLFGLSPYDPATMFTAAAVLLGVSLASGLRPAWRAAKVDPMVALRYE